MVDIVDRLHDYVPTDSLVHEVDVDGQKNEVIDDNFFKILLGGDQMTCARVRGSQRIRTNSERGRGCLQGVAGVCEDWHAKMCLLGVIWKRLYKCSSGNEGGTLYQLRNLINRRSVVQDPSKNMNACEDFFTSVVEAHILAAAMSQFKMSSLQDEPEGILFADNCCKLDYEQRSNIVLLEVGNIIDEYIDLSFGQDKKKAEDNDHVLSYAREVLTFGLLYLEFVDAIRSGDGNRILCCWKFFLLYFKSSNRVNYSIEAFTLLAQEKYLFSPRMSMQLKWSRTVNVHGRQGKNISCDLHMEHLNRECKDAMRGLGANLNNASIERIGKCLGKTVELLNVFDNKINIKQKSGFHTARSSKGDIEKMLDQLLEKSKVFQNFDGRFHKSFPKFQCNMMLHKLSVVNINEWMTQQMERLITYG